MRIGDILLQREWVRFDDLIPAVMEQPRTQLRLCSLLLERGVLAFDHASQALGEQLGVPGALQKHLQHRDQALAKLLPEHFARERVALPIGRLGGGELIVCVRDPRPELAATIARALRQTVMLAVAPARTIEQLVDRAYKQAPRAPASEIAIELVEEPPPLPPPADFELDVEVSMPPGESSADELVDLEPETAPAPVAGSASKALPVEIRPIAARPAAPVDAHSLEATIASFPDIDDLEWLRDAVMGFVRARWRTGLWLEVAGDEARDASLRLSLAEPSLVQAARERRRIVDEAPPATGAAHAQLLVALGDPERPIAAPLVCGDRVPYVLAVGDPHAGDPDDAIVDLARLVEALEEAIVRLA